MDDHLKNPLPVSLDIEKLAPALLVSVDKKKQLPPLPVSMADKKTEALADLFLSVQQVIQWTLFNVLSFAFSLGLGFAIGPIIPCSPSSWWNPCVEATDAQEREAMVLLIGMLCCTVLQAAAAALPLLLPGHRRRALAAVALVATAVNHGLYAASLWLVLAAAPGDIFLRISGTVTCFTFAVVDLLCFLGLLLGGDEE